MFRVDPHADMCSVSSSPPPEFSAIAGVFPQAMALLCFFHVARNVKSEATSVLGAVAAGNIHRHFEVMTRLTADERDGFYRGIEAIFQVVFGNSEPALPPTYQLTAVIAAIKSMLACFCAGLALLSDLCASLSIVALVVCAQDFCLALTCGCCVSVVLKLVLTLV